MDFPIQRSGSGLTDGWTNGSGSSLAGKDLEHFNEPRFCSTFGLLGYLRWEGVGFSFNLLHPAAASALPASTLALARGTR